MAQCEIVFIIVNTGAQLNQVLFGDAGLIDSLQEGHKQTIVVMSTISPKVIKEIHTSINNIVALGNAYVFTEALTIGVEADIDIDRIVEVMSASSGKNWCTDNSHCISCGL